MKGESLWPRLAGFPVVIETCEYERLHAVLAYEFERITTHVLLVGAGVTGWRTFRCSGRTAPRCMRPDRCCRSRENGHWPASVSTSRRSNCGPSRLSREGARRFRRWAFESAALDLALRQSAEVHKTRGGQQWETARSSFARSTPRSPQAKRRSTTTREGIAKTPCHFRR
jgi:hypothetical protein